MLGYYKFPVRQALIHNKSQMYKKKKKRIVRIKNFFVRSAT